MPQALAALSYDVAVKRETLRAWELTGTAYSIQLVGEIDRRWLAAFLAIRADSVGFSRFHLDSTSKMVVFACRSEDTAEDVGFLIDLLESLVGSTNLYASGAEAGRGQA